MTTRFKGSLQGSVGALSGGSFLAGREIHCGTPEIFLDEANKVLYFTFMLINETVKQQPPSTDLDFVFGALADPTRRAILVRLAEGEVSVKGLAEPFKISLPAVSRHLKVLERAGLIARG